MHRHRTETAVCEKDGFGSFWQRIAGDAEHCKALELHCLCQFNHSDLPFAVHCGLFLEVEGYI